MNKLVKSYANLAAEIKRRVDLANRIGSLLPKNESLTGQYDFDLEIIFLQIRKVCESYAFLCSFGPTFDDEKLDRQIGGHYQPSIVWSKIEKISPVYLPTPVQPVKTGDGTWVQLADPLFDADQLRKFIIQNWKYASEALHKKRKESEINRNNLPVLAKNANEFLLKIMGNLKCHEIRISDEAMIYTVMQDASDGKTRSQLLEQIEAPMK